MGTTGTGFKEMVPTVEAVAEPSEPNIHCKVRGQSLVILPGCGLEEKLMGEVVLISGRIAYRRNALFTDRMASSREGS